MRAVLAFLLVLCGAGAPLNAVPNRVTKKEAVRAERRMLQGSWVMVRWQRAASVIVYNPNEKFYVWNIRGDKLTANQGGLGWPMDSRYTIDPSVNPNTLDAVELGGANKGKTGRYIYQRDGDTLTVCHGGIGQPRPKDFTGKGVPSAIVIVFSRLKS
jgi:uncharacterized protein (TIGR03067 family)